MEDLACDVVVAWYGHVQRPGEVSLGSIGSGPGRVVPIAVVPSESGSALLRVTAYYNDSRGHPQMPAYLEVRLQVAEPAQVRRHFHGPRVGPHVAGDGVIIVREGGGGSQRTTQV
jgi:hypothetical protein